MYKVRLYSTANGNTPIRKYMVKLSAKNKVDDMSEIEQYIGKLEEFGPEINERFKPDAVKHIREKIYELRPSSTRIFYFYYNDDGVYILLHAYEKKQNKTDPNEIAKAIKEKNDYIKRNN